MSSCSLSVKRKNEVNILLNRMFRSLGCGHLVSGLLLCAGFTEKREKNKVLNSPMSLLAHYKKEIELIS